MTQIYPSDILDWYRCPARRARQGRPQRPPYRHVGTEVGNRVHAAVTGQKNAEDGSLIRFDEITRDIRELGQHTRQIVNRVGALVDRLRILETERPVSRALRIGEQEIEIRGRIDLVVEKDDEIAIVDLKVGKAFPAEAWTQLAIYAWLADALDRPPPVTVGVLFAERGRDFAAYDLYRPNTDEMRRYAYKMLTYPVMWAVQPDTAPANPGMAQCAECTLECPVRAAPQEERP